jgi:hypothetical protein
MYLHFSWLLLFKKCRTNFVYLSYSFEWGNSRFFNDCKRRETSIAWTLADLYNF